MKYFFIILFDSKTQIQKTMYNKANNSATSLSRLGRTRKNNSVRFKGTSSTKVGVAVEQSSLHRALRTEVIVPITRSTRGSRRVAKFELNGAQTWALYETLSKFYADRDSDVRARNLTR